LDHTLFFETSQKSRSTGFVTPSFSPIHAFLVIR
jgi:hypothetical protein